MRTTDVSEYGDQSCSCTSCIFRSESDRPSLKRIISQGSRIDRLYYGKYIPLRERKLLEKLVRTRGVYDNIKAQLLSSSTVSIDTKSAIKPHRKLSVKKLNDHHHSDAILELVDLVDRGEKLGSKELSGCCSCCSCSSKFNLHKSTGRGRPKRAYPGGYRQIHTREKIENRKRGVRFKTKHIKSDPCTCTLKFSGMLKKISNAKLKKIRAYHPTTLVDLMPTTDEEINQKPKNISRLSKSSLENLRHSKTYVKDIMMEGVRKFSESKTKIQEKINLHTKKSLDELKKINNNIKSKINVKRKSREVPNNNNILKNNNICECPEKSLLSQIRKDSLSKFKDDLIRKRNLKDWECDSDCIEDICVPEECYYKLKRLRSGHLRRNYKDIREPLMSPSIKIQSKKLHTFVPAVVDKQKPILRSQQTRPISKPWQNVSTDKERKKSKTVQNDMKKTDKKKLQFLCKCKNSKHKSQNVKSSALMPPTVVIKNRTKNLKENPPHEKGIHIYSKSKLEDLRSESRQQIVRIGSSFTFNIEFYKNKAEPFKSKSKIDLQRLPNYSKRSVIKQNKEKHITNTKIPTMNRRQRGSQIKLEYPKKSKKTGEDNFKRCFCPLKLKYKKNKFKTDTKIKKDQVMKEKSLMTLNSVSDLCTPLDCIVSNKCNLIECKRYNQNLLNNIETSTHYNYPNIIKITKKGKKKFINKELLLPYECEPGVCEPNSCDPYECIKLISARKVKSKHRSVQCECSPKRSYSGKNKSTSSLNTTKPKHLNVKPKYVKSQISYKSDKFRNKINKIKNMRTKRMNHPNTNRNGHQVVRIGSTFSFNLEFHKTKSPQTLNPNIFNRISDETRPLLYNKTSNQKSVAITPINKPLHKRTAIGTTLKRCFCTLKLQEKKNIKTKRKKILATETDFVNNIHSNAVVTYNKSTKTKNNRLLLPMECEPFVCIPGACDPYECLERINKRYKRIKEVGSTTEHPENKSVSSTTYSKKSFKSVNVQSNKPYSKDRKSSARSKNISSKLKRYTSDGKSNQAVKIGSSISFNIEFIKTNTPIKDINSKLKMKQTIQQKSIKEKKNKRKNNNLNVASVTTQIKEDRKLPKASMANHFVKRCFCTLNLQKYRKLQPPIVPKEYTINTAITGPTPFLTSNGHEIQSYEKQCDIGHSHKKDKFRHFNYLQSILTQGSFSDVKKLSQSCSLNSLYEDKCSSSFNFIQDRMMYLKQTEVTNLNQYIRQCFCTMNLQLVHKNISNRKPKSAIPFSTGNSPKKTLQNNKEPTKSSVRVGSTFSFNIDFSKNISSSLSKSKKYVDNLLISKYSPETKSKKIKNIGTKRHDVTYHNQLLQSEIGKLAHKASATAPRKCFCTLKLQKKGRWYKNVQAMRGNKNQVTNIIKPSLSKVTTVNKSQNTVFKPLHLAHSLKPYECEPNICTPGYCDPYKCLEIMKRRKFYKHTKESGMGTIQTKESVSSLTIGNISKGTQRSYMRPKQSEAKKTRRKIEPDVFKPSRQVVRIGSNFSFNIEFFKDQLSPAGVKMAKDEMEWKEGKHIKRIPEIKKRNKDQITSQNSNFVRDKNTEIKKKPRIASTMTTAFRKRCFCVAQLKDINKKSVSMHLNDKPTFLNKCLCFFKSIKTFTAKKEGNRLKKIPHLDKKINTQNVTMLDEHQRYPYECEPGICVPGECNPYECYKILKRRNDKSKSKASTAAETKSVRSTYSNSDKLVTKTAKTQLKNRQRDIKKKSFSQPYLKNSNRNVVKIGSNFSFNIEFYKDKLPHDMNKPLQQLYSKPKEKKYKESDKNIMKHEIVKTHSQRSQINPIRKTDQFTEDKQFLKRCFCTLQLHNKYSNVPKGQVKEKKKHQGIKLSTKSVMTKKDKHPLNISKFFECEPDICVPYQCDPYECEKIMKSRREQKGDKEVGSLTESPKKFAVTSATKPLKISKVKTQTMVTKNYKKKSYNNNIFNEQRPMQKVKIGSNFEFNIEFYKNKNNVGLLMNKQPKLANIKSIRPTKEKLSKFKTQNWKHKAVKFEKNATRVTKSQATVINISPPLKKPKNLFFKKPKLEKHKTLKNITSSIGTETRAQLAHATLLPYECEPQVCIPGECNPIECLERIKKRNKNFGVTTNFLQKTNSVSTMTPGKPKSKTRKNQFKSLNKDELPSKKEPSANSKKQAVRIGSNFNFNIEFYKDSAEPYTVIEKLNNLNKVHGGHKTSGYKVNQQLGKPLKMKSQLLRPDNSILKRCFCTLQLRKQACVVSNCPELKAHSAQTKEKKNEYKTRNKSKIDKKIRTPTFFKKCLCVLKIRKIDRQKHTKPEVIKQQVIQRRLNQNVSTQEELLPFECEPNVCLPGKCDPYECDKRIRKRILKRKLNNESYVSHQSATDKVKLKSIKVQGPTRKTQKHKQTLYLHKKPNLNDSDNMERNRNKGKITKESLQKRNKVVDISELNDNSNKQAVKIGSNISFNVEFYKQNTPKMISNMLENSQKLSNVVNKIPKKGLKDNLYNKNISTNLASIRNSGSQAKVIKTEDKTLEAKNTLNRCFCTLKLQKNVNSRYREKNLNSLSKSPQYPQVFEIRRVAVQHKSKWPSRKTYSTVRSVATRINKKYMKENKNLNSLRNICPCKSLIVNSTEMETILPYTPTKFKKNSSKTLLPMQNKILIKNKVNRVNKTSHGKKLNKKKSKRNIKYNKNKNELKVKSTTLKTFICRCAALFTRNPKSNNLSTISSNRKNYPNNNDKMHSMKPKQTCNICFENLRSSKSDRRPMRQLVNRNKTIKKSKSLKIVDKCDIKCMKYPVVTLRVDKKRNDENDAIKETNNPQQANNLKSAKVIPDEEIRSNVQTNSIKRKQQNDEVMCVHCHNKIEKLKKGKIKKRISSPLKVHFIDVPPDANFLDESPNLKKHRKSVKEYLKREERNEEHSKYYKYCSTCGRKINKVELQKAAGDHSVNENNKKSIKYRKDRIKDIFKLCKNADNVCSGENRERPLFEMQLNSDDYDILNKEEVIDNVTKLSKKSTQDKLTKSHKKSCRCCLCLSKQNKTGAHIHVAAKGSKICRHLGKLLGNSKADTPTIGQPCTCGSYICSKKNQKIKTKSHKIKVNKTHWKRCLCGSPICDRESATMRAISISPDKVKCICKQENEKLHKKIKAKKEKEVAKHRDILLKKQTKEDRIRRKKRQKQDKEMEKRINKKAGDIVLAAESAIDIGKLGITAGTNILRSVARCASDPKQAYNTLKAMKDNPKLLERHLKSAFDDSGVAATARRVRLRCLAMKGVKKVRNTLERYAITNFLLHIADKNPKRRLPKPYKPKRVRERLDFGCSLYMASLRKRPYLSVYDRCPWFYPHFLSLVNVWKQFVDIMLFLLAVAVWSPCILCMEVCRAMMCCFFCTG